MQSFFATGTISNLQVWDTSKGAPLGASSTATGERHCSLHRRDASLFWG